MLETTEKLAAATLCTVSPVERLDGDGRTHDEVVAHKAIAVGGILPRTRIAVDAFIEKLIRSRGAEAFFTEKLEGFGALALGLAHLRVPVWSAGRAFVRPLFLSEGALTAL